MKSMSIKIAYEAQMLKGQCAGAKLQMGKLLCIQYFLEGYKNSILLFYLTQDVTGPLPIFFS